MTYILKEFNLPDSWTPSAIRMSVAIKTMWLESGKISSVASKLNHKKDSPVTNGYALSYPIRGLLEHYIRQFQDLFQFATALNIKGAVETLGCPKSEVPILKERVTNSGLGFLWLNQNAMCVSSNPLSLGKDHELKNTDCRILIVADTENLSKVIAANQILSEQMQQLETQFPSQWEHKWAPLLALTQVVIEKVKRSEFAYNLSEANTLAQDLINSGYNPITSGGL